MENTTSCDPTSAIQRFLEIKFSSERIEKCSIAVEAYEIKNWKKHFRLIGLIKKRTTHAVVIFTAKKLVNNSFHNIRVIDVIPLNLEFKITTDNCRSSNGEYQPTIMTGLDFTLQNFDPLLSKSQNEANECDKKYFQLDFLKCDFETFSTHIDKACEFKKQGEVYSSFNWLQKLRDEAESSSEISNDLRLSESENDLKTHSENSSPRNSLKRTSDRRENMNSHSPQIAQHPLNQQSFENLEFRRSRQSETKFMQNHFPSTPDLLNSKDVVIHDKFSEVINDDRQFEYVESKLKQKEEDYCNWEDNALFVGTWNVNGRLDESISLDDWLNPPSSIKYPSFYVIGFQELDLSIGSVALNRSNTNNLEEKWLKLIENSSPFRKNKYKRLYRARLSGILLVIYVHEKLVASVPDSDVTFSKVPTGMFNVMGNKGGVGIRFKAWNSNLCFINCHLAAGESNRFRRDQDFREIEKNMVFRDEYDKPLSIYNHDLIFLMGDLNYRLINIEVNEVKLYIQQGSVELLMANDELTKESKTVFRRFHEGKIQFMPTYKFDANTDEYDTSEKNRIPSFCDRIMWNGEHCVLKHYNSHMSLRTSDHKPVSAWFNIGLKKIDERKRLKVQEAIIRCHDLMYNLSLPQATVNKQEINFDQVHFYEHRHASISIKNTGQYEFKFKFKEIPGRPRIPDWLTIQPSEGHVKPEEEHELIFEIFINANNVRELNTTKEVQCILVLDLQGGKDYFITVTAELVPTSFGLPLSLLVTLRNPISTFSREDLFEKCKPYVQRDSFPTQNMGSIEFTTPKEIFAMLDYLMRHVKEEELFARPGSHCDIQVIREQLDVYGVDANFDEVSVHSVTETLLMFLSSLYFPIIPTKLMKECTGVSTNFRESVKVIGKFPQDHQNLFHYLTSFLRRVLDNRNDNGTDITSLAMLFVDLMFRSENRENFERDACTQFIKQFLTNDPVKYFRTGHLPTH